MLRPEELREGERYKLICGDAEKSEYVVVLYSIGTCVEEVAIDGDSHYAEFEFEDNLWEGWFNVAKGRWFEVDDDEGFDIVDVD